MPWSKNLFALVLIAAVLLAACAPASAPTQPGGDSGAAASGEPVKGGTVIVGTPQEPGPGF